MGKWWKQWETLFWGGGSKIITDGDCSHEIKKTLAPWKKSYDQPRQHIKKQRLTLPTKVHLVKAVVFPVVMYGCELDYKENWALKNWCFWTVVLEDHSCGVESPLDCKEIQPVHPKGNQPWIFIGRTDAEAQTPILWPCDVKNWLIGKDLDGVKGWRWEKGTTGWDGWKASPTQWTWVWVSPGSWWRTGKPGMLQSMGLQRVGHGWATELNWKRHLELLINRFGVTPRHFW